MGNILVTATPGPGHVNPLLTIAQDLNDRGHSILFHTATAFRDQVEAAGLRFLPLIGKADFDYRTFNKFIPDGAIVKPGLDELLHNFKHVLGDCMLPQYDGIRQILGREPVDLILTDWVFFGVLPLLLGPPDQRPPIVSVSVSPLAITSPDATALGPTITHEEKERNRQETGRFQASLASVNEHLDNLLARCNRPPLPGFFLDCVYKLPDLVLQLSPEELEFPRSDLPERIKFVGPVLPKASSNFEPPDWWNRLDGLKPVVLVTQGTVANRDLTELIIPTLRALANENVTVIAATGRLDGPLSEPIPRNAEVTAFIPFMELLPKIDVFVTNGGFGAVNQALSMGVPLVVAGDTEDKPFVAARVAWTGAGINLSTSRPTPDQIRHAVHRVLSQPEFRANAQRLRGHYASYDARDLINRHVASLLAQKRETRSQAACSAESAR